MCLGDDLEASGLLRARDGGDVRAVLRVDVAAAAIAEAVVHARRAILEALGVDRRRAGEGMPAQRPRGRGHAIEIAGTAQRRHRVRPPPRRFVDVAATIDGAEYVAGLARHADLMLHQVVVRLELFVAERPVLHGGPRRKARAAVAAGGLAHHLEVPRRQAPALRPVVQRGAADAVHHHVAGGPRRRRRRVDPVRRHLAIALLHRHRPVAHVVADLVGCEVLAGEPGAGLEAYHAQASLGQRQHGDAAGGAEPDHHHIRSRQISRHRGRSRPA